MSLTVFLAICILGCDMLIYFLYEWALGESKRIRKHRVASRLRADGTSATQDELSRVEWRRATGTRGTDGNLRGPVAPLARPAAQKKRLAYRRLAASFAPLKPRT